VGTPLKEVSPKGCPHKIHKAKETWPFFIMPNKKIFTIIISLTTLTAFTCSQTVCAASCIRAKSAGEADMVQREIATAMGIGRHNFNEEEISGMLMHEIVNLSAAVLAAIMDVFDKLPEDSELKTKIWLTAKGNARRGGTGISTGWQTFSERSVKCWKIIFTGNFG